MKSSSIEVRSECVRVIARTMQVKNRRERLEQCNSEEDRGPPLNASSEAFDSVYRLNSQVPGTKLLILVRGHAFRREPEKNGHTIDAEQVRKNRSKLPVQVARKAIPGGGERNELHIIYACSITLHLHRARDDAHALRSRFHPA